MRLLLLFVIKVTSISGKEIAIAGVMTNPQRPLVFQYCKMLGQSVTVDGGFTAI